MTFTATVTFTAWVLAVGVLIGCFLGVAMMISICDDLIARSSRAEQRAGDLETLIRSDKGDFRHRADVVDHVPYRDGELRNLRGLNR